MEKTCKVIMLATDVYTKEIHPPFVIIDNKLTMIYNPAYYDQQRNYQHLYFVSTDKDIKKGDYVYSVKQDDVKEQIVEISDFYPDGYYKVLASTDKRLGLPSIPDSFLQEYVEKKGTISTVEVDLIKDKIKVKAWWIVDQNVRDFYAKQIKQPKETVEQAYQKWANEHNNGVLNGRDFGLFKIAVEWGKANVDKRL